MKNEKKITDISRLSQTCAINVLSTYWFNNGNEHGKPTRYKIT
jgi:hypothetical protein